MYGEGNVRTNHVQNNPPPVPHCVTLILLLVILTVRLVVNLS